MRPSSATEQWHDRLAQPDVALKIAGGMAKLAVVEAPNSETEALAIAVAMREAAHTAAGLIRRLGDGRLVGVGLGLFAAGETLLVVPSLPLVLLGSYWATRTPVTEREPVLDGWIVRVAAVALGGVGPEAPRFRAGLSFGEHVGRNGFAGYPSRPVSAGDNGPIQVQDGSLMQIGRAHV